MKIIKLTQGYNTIVDDADFQYLSKWKWFYNKGYVRRSDYSTGKLIKIYMHREIMKPPKGMVIDHIDSDKLNNQRSNLRICTHQQNQCNRKKYKNNKSGYKGVSFNKRDCKWVAGIGVGGMKKHLGSFTTAEEASKAYEQASIKLHGVYGKVK